jgi:hypothetical protein
MLRNDSGIIFVFSKCLENGWLPFRWKMYGPLHHISSMCVILMKGNYILNIVSNIVRLV